MVLSSSLLALPCTPLQSTSQYWKHWAGCPRGLLWNWMWDQNKCQRISWWEHTVKMLLQGLWIFSLHVCSASIHKPNTLCTKVHRQPFPFLHNSARTPLYIVTSLHSGHSQILPYVPQQAILAHNKTLLFFTQGSVNAAMEGIANRVPMVGMPVYADQGDCMTRVVGKGLGVSLQKTSTAEEIYDAIVSVRDDPQFRNNVNHLADLMALERNTPLENAVWLAEYVANTKGAEHLKVSTRKLTTIQVLEKIACLQSIKITQFPSISAIQHWFDGIHHSHGLHCLQGHNLLSMGDSQGGV